MNKHVPHFKDGVSVGTMPDFADVQSLGLTNPVVRACLEMMREYGLTREQALSSMVIHLARQNDGLVEELVRASMTEKVVYYWQGEIKTERRPLPPRGDKHVSGQERSE